MPEGGDVLSNSLIIAYVTRYIAKLHVYQLASRAEIYLARQLPRKVASHRGGNHLC